MFSAGKIFDLRVLEMADLASSPKSSKVFKSGLILFIKFKCSGKRINDLFLSAP